MSNTEVAWPYDTRFVLPWGSEITISAPRSYVPTEESWTTGGNSVDGTLLSEWRTTDLPVDYVLWEITVVDRVSERDPGNPAEARELADWQLPDELPWVVFDPALGEPGLLDMEDAPFLEQKEMSYGEEYTFPVVLGFHELQPGQRGLDVRPENNALYTTPASTVPPAVPLIVFTDTAVVGSGNPLKRWD